MIAITTRRFVVDPLRMAVAVGCVYELVALPKRSPLPPITTLCQTADRPVEMVASLAFIGYLSGHLLGLDNRQHWPHLAAWMVGGALTASLLRRLDN